MVKIFRVQIGCFTSSRQKVGDDQTVKLHRTATRLGKSLKYGKISTSDGADLDLEVSKNMMAFQPKLGLPGPIF